MKATRVVNLCAFIYFIYNYQFNNKSGNNLKEIVL